MEHLWNTTEVHLLAVLYKPRTRNGRNDQILAKLESALISVIFISRRARFIVAIGLT